jgi:hypothetical protein
MERPVDAAARPTNSGEVTGGDGRRGIDTNGTGTTLTSWRRSGRAPQRRSGDDGEDPRRRRGLGFWARCGTRGRGSGVSGRASRGRRSAINSPGGRLGVRATHGDACAGRTRWRREARPSPARGPRAGGDDKGAPPVSGTGRGMRLRRGWAGGAGPRGCWDGGAVAASWAAKRSGLRGC